VKPGWIPFRFVISLWWASSDLEYCDPDDALNCNTGSLFGKDETKHQTAADDDSWIGHCCWWADVDHLQPRRTQDKGRFCIDVVALEMRLELEGALGQMKWTLANDWYLPGVDSEVKAAALDEWAARGLSSWHTQLRKQDKAKFCIDVLVRGMKSSE
jgi:hypothetical protein